MKVTLDITYCKIMELELPDDLANPMDDASTLKLNNWCWTQFQALNNDENAPEFVVAVIVDPAKNGETIWES